MAAPISLREDFDGPMLRALALSVKAGSVTRRFSRWSRFTMAVRGPTPLAWEGSGCKPLSQALGTTSSS